MIVSARNQAEWNALASFLQHYATVKPTADLQLIGWVSDEGKLVAVVGFNGFIGKVAQIHVAFDKDWHFTPRALLREVFRYAFVTCDREMLIGVVNSRNVKAMRYDLRIGFREAFRFPGMHDDGGDIVLLTMKKSDCRYLEAPDAVAVAQARSA